MTMNLQLKRKKIDKDFRKDINVSAYFHELQKRTELKTKHNYSTQIKEACFCFLFKALLI